MSSAAAAATPSGSTFRKHALTPAEVQRNQLDKLLKDPAKPAFIPPPPKEKTLRPPREMMKNVQGSSAGAGSGEFHVYKANRRREYERLKIMDEEAQAVCRIYASRLASFFNLDYRNQLRANSNRKSGNEMMPQSRRRLRIARNDRKRNN